MTPVPDSPLSLGARQKGGMTYAPSDACRVRWEMLRSHTIAMDAIQCAQAGKPHGG